MLMSSSVIEKSKDLLVFARLYIPTSEFNMSKPRRLVLRQNDSCQFHVRDDMRDMKPYKTWPVMAISFALTRPF